MLIHCLNCIGPIGADVNHPALDPNFEARERMICGTVGYLASHRIETGAVHWTLDVAAAGEPRRHELEISMRAGPVESVHAFGSAGECDGSAGDLNACHVGLAELVQRDYLYNCPSLMRSRSEKDA